MVKQALKPKALADADETCSPLQGPQHYFGFLWQGLVGTSYRHYYEGPNPKPSTLNPKPSTLNPQP